MSEKANKLPPMSEAEIRELFAGPRTRDLYSVAFHIENQTIDALELVFEHLQRVPDRPLSWKWILIGMHTALHGSFGLALSGTTNAPLLVPWQEKQFWERVNVERETGILQNFFTFTWADPETGEQKEVEPKIDSFPNLYRKVCKKNRMQHLGGQPLRPTSDQKASIHLVNRKRNDLVHFSTLSLVFDIPQLMDAIGHCLEVVRFLLTEAQPIDTITDPDEASRARTAISEISDEISAVRERY